MSASASPARLGLIAATSIVVASMIGTGVFTTTGYQAASLHGAPLILAAWVLGGVLALCGASAYAELGAMMPKAGGEYVYLREAYHPVLGFLSGWVSLFAGFSAPIAVSALAFGTYSAAAFAPWWPALADPWTQKGLAVGVVIAMTTLHGLDTVVGARVQAVLSIAKASLILVFIGAGLLVGSGDLAHFSTPAGSAAASPHDFAISLMYVTFAYSGWNAAAYIAGDIRDPARTVPRALLLGTALVTTLYVLLNVTFLYALSPATLAGAGGDTGPIGEVGDAAARALFGDTAATLLTTLIALGLVSSVSAMVMAGPRVYAAMAEDHGLPALLARRSARGVPWVSVLLQGALAVAVVLIGELGEVLRYVGTLLSVFAALTVAAVVVLRFTRKDAPRPYRTFGYPVTPVMFIAMAIWVTYAQIEQNPDEVVWAIGTLVAGLVVWAIGRAFGRAPVSSSRG